MEINTLTLSNEFSDSNFRQLGFVRDIHSKDYELCCQYKHYKYACKRVVLVVSLELDKVYALIDVKDYNEEGEQVSQTSNTLHFTVDTISELIQLIRMLQRQNINFQK